MPFRALISAAIVLCHLAAAAVAANDNSFASYLRDKGLTAGECLERPPRELMGWIVEREKLGYIGTPSHEQAVIDLFYDRYRATLRPAVDSRYPNAKTLREPLQKLHCLIFDFMSSINGSRTYVTHDRIAAYTEHVLAQLYSTGGTRTAAVDSHPSDADVATFARLKAALWYDNGRERPNYDRFSEDVLAGLKAVETADPKVPSLNIRFYLVDFIDRYASLLNPNVADFR